MNHHHQHPARHIGKDQKMFLAMLAAALIATLIFVLWPRFTASQQLEPRAAFAACLTSKGVAMYGSDTCPNCQMQKGMFEDDFRRVNYINCAVDQEECTKNDIQKWPTWMYNGQRLLGVQTFQNLEAFTGCKAP